MAAHVPGLRWVGLAPEDMAQFLDGDGDDAWVEEVRGLLPPRRRGGESKPHRPPPNPPHLHRPLQVPRSSLTAATALHKPNVLLTATAWRVPAEGPGGDACRVVSAGPGGRPGRQMGRACAAVGGLMHLSKACSPMRGALLTAICDSLTPSRCRQAAGMSTAAGPARPRCPSALAALWRGRSFSTTPSSPSPPKRCRCRLGLLLHW